MGFNIDVPPESRKDDISDVHLRAMRSNELLHAQFPNPEAIAYLHGWLGRNTVQHIHDDDKGTMVALDVKGGKMASFIKWLLHRKTEQEAPDGDEEWPDCCRREYLDSYGALTESVRDDVMGKEAYYREQAPTAGPRR
jgi:hypothetical protein